MIEPTKRFTLKLFAATHPPGYPRKIVPVFHRWIQQSILPGEIWIDVADYSHVHRGPGVMLAGHASDLALDTGDGRLGLVLRHKRRGAPDLSVAVDRALETLLEAAVILSGETELRFDAGRVQLTLLDRRHAANDSGTRTALATFLAALLRRHGGDRSGSIEVLQGEPVSGLATFPAPGSLAPGSG